MRRGPSGQPELAQDREKEDAASTVGWHDRPRLELAARLSTDPVQGLRGEQAAERLAEDGPSELRKGNANPHWPFSSISARALTLLSFNHF